MTAAKKKAFVLRMKKARAAAKRKPAANPGFLPRKLFDRYDVVDARSGKVFNKGLQTLSGARRKAKKHLGSCDINIVSQQTGSTVQTLKNPNRKPTPKKKNAAKKKAPARRKNKLTTRPGPKGKPKKQKGPGKRAKATRKKVAARGRLNPEEMREAEEMFLQFHGRPANRIIEHNERHEYRDELAELGHLLILRFDLDDEYEQPLSSFGGKCQVACTPDGHQIYFHGGNMAVDLEALGLPTDKDYIALGECTYIEYLTVKGFHDFEPTRYQHDFGEETGVRPVLMYDAINKVLYLAGGEYQVKPAGIVN
jgi:hypothetical protein